MRHQYIFFCFLSVSLSLSCRGDRLVANGHIPREAYPESHTIWGFMNPKGQVVIPAKFNEVRDFHEGLAAFRQGYLWGYLTPSGEIAIPAAYLEAYPFSHHLARVITDEGRTLFITPSGKSAFDLHCSEAGNFRNGLAKIRQNGKVGYIDTLGQVVIAPKYEEGFEFNMGVTTVVSNKKFGLIDTSGRYLLKPKYDFIYFGKITNEPICLIKKKGKVGYYNFQKRTFIAPYFDQGQPFYEQTAVVKKDTLFGAINSQGRWIVQPIFSNLLNLGQHRWALSFDNQLFMIDSTGLQYGEGFRQIYRFSENLAIAQIDHKWGFINPSGEFAIPPIYDLVWPFKNGIARVAVESGVGYIDTTGQFVIPPQQADIRDFQEGLARFNVPE